MKMKCKSWGFTFDVIINNGYLLPTPGENSFHGCVMFDSERGHIIRKEIHLYPPDPNYIRWAKERGFFVAGVYNMTHPNGNKLCWVAYGFIPIHEQWLKGLLVEDIESGFEQHSFPQFIVEEVK